MAALIVVLVIAYLGFHLGSGATHHRYQKAHGLSPNLYWSAARGPYGSIRLPGNFRLGHRL